MLKLEITGFTAEEILNYAMAGLLARHQHTAAKIAEIRGQLSGTTTSPAIPAVKRGRPAAIAAPKPAQKPAKPSGRRPLSPEALANIVAAQKRRWAKVRKDQRAADKLTAAPQGRRRMELAEPEPAGELAEAAS